MARVPGDHKKFMLTNEGGGGGSFKTEQIRVFYDIAKHVSTPMQNFGE